jgi:hypothetical protein
MGFKVGQVLPDHEDQEPGRFLRILADGALMATGLEEDLLAKALKGLKKFPLLAWLGRQKGAHDFDATVGGGFHGLGFPLGGYTPKRKPSAKKKPVFILSLNIYF